MGQLPLPTRVAIPTSWSAAVGEYRGRVELVRHFQQPTNLTDELVTLAVDGADAWADVELNGQLLGRVDGGGRFSVAGQLQPRNTLRLTVELPRLDQHSAPLADGTGERLLEEVRLEIETPAD